jgi:hypothetical protein
MVDCLRRYSHSDRELRDCDRLLRDRAASLKHPSLQPFKARRVEGAGEPSHLKNVVEVRDWTPVDTAIRIDNPISLIDKLGGWHLYGNDYSSPVREALQNAADAVRARRRRTGYDDKSAYPGRIDIIFHCDPSDQNLSKLKMIIADDGVGMWPGTMTGALLDFGRSFWDSAEVAERYPGLLSDPQFQPTRKFGIGFYSIFMIADDVKVVSRSWQAGERDCARSSVQVRHLPQGSHATDALRSVLIRRRHFPRSLMTTALMRSRSPSEKADLCASKSLRMVLRISRSVGNRVRAPLEDGSGCHRRTVVRRRTLQNLPSPRRQARAPLGDSSDCQ